MKKQVIVIHGGEVFDSYEEYISYLKNKKVDIDSFKARKDWKNTLEAELGEGFGVLLPRMPNGANARYEEWEIWFSKLIPFLEDGAVLMGHSLGGIFLAKYLALNTLPKKIGAVILVAAPFDDESKESLGGFKLPADLENIPKQAGKICLIHSEDDYVVSPGEVHKYEKALPGAEVITFKDRNHFINQEHFPEVVELLRNI